MAKAASAAAGATPLRRGLPEEIVVWEILVRLSPRSLLRCRAVCRAWRRVTSTRDFLLAHHGRQPSLPVISRSRFSDGPYHDILAFDHRDAASHLHPVARLGEIFSLEASCDGLLILSYNGVCISVCNPATRHHAALPQLWRFSFLAMYPHRPTDEYRLLLRKQRSNKNSPEEKSGCYVFALGSNQPPRYIGWPEIASASFKVPARVRDSLHWYPVYDPCQSKLITVFDTIAESFRQMRAPVVPTNSYIFEMDSTLGIYSCNKTAQIVDIWLLQNYESETWDLKYRVVLPIGEIRGKFEGRDGHWFVTVASGYGDVLLLINFGSWLFYVDTDGKVVASFKDFYLSELRHKQTLVPHTFFTALDCYGVDAFSFHLTSVQ